MQAEVQAEAEEKKKGIRLDALCFLLNLNLSLNLLLINY